MKTLANVGPLKLLDLERTDGAVRLEDEHRAICDLALSEVEVAGPPGLLCERFSAPPGVLGGASGEPGAPRSVISWAPGVRGRRCPKSRSLSPARCEVANLRASTGARGTSS